MKISQSACVTLFICLSTLSWAQQNPAPALAPRPAPELAPQNKEGRIHLDVVVTDKSGKPVSGLELKDFALLDNKRPNPILSFAAIDGTVQKADPPVDVILLLDTENISLQYVTIAQNAIVKFLRQNGGHLAQPVSFFLLTSQGVEAHPPTTDGNELATEVGQLDSRLRAIGQSAGAWGDVERYQFSLQMMMSIAADEAQIPGRKLLIWLGKGWPMLDNVMLQSSSKDQQQTFNEIVQLSTVLREAHIFVYSVSWQEPGLGSTMYEDFLKGVKTPANANAPNLSLKVLAVQSGGRVLGPYDDLTAEINSCLQDAGAFYTLSFDPPRTDRANEYHDITVKIDKPGLTARTNTGYYNQP